MTGQPAPPAGARALVVTVSDRAHRGVYPDRSGPLLVEALAELGFDVPAAVIVPDERAEITSVIRAAADAGTDLVVTTGGTGLGPRDVTPEATRGLLERELPGLAEALRAAGRDKVPTAVLSRGLAGTVGATLVVNLPGSTGGVRDGIGVLTPVIAHAIAQLRGDTNHADPSHAAPSHSDPSHAGPSRSGAGHLLPSGPASAAGDGAG
ncbi:molybdenum cofactor biosynthesis protein [Parafrankia colletiae]|uniref:Molybdenum cofactor biosynthesis protein n=1 Tax=Parafrankia colletiae TaxID=573497 RepID=A0A1S1QRV4_9ACTN|nr:MogA/MoaB family molybdenum cofactor biosynthesis protein [Parafrankia colletiae]MCK9901413.1 MogA/MoaB family molybdenum cofactor biosynthesis protein [Frankia sp. Cpl3]OHV36299.1 molybdenum cofactor biosynthesis protein [Parafrankia colletiae]